MRALNKSFAAMTVLMLTGLFSPFLSAQEVFRGVGMNGNVQDRAALNKAFESYTLFELDHKALYDAVDANREQALFKLQVADFDWTVELYENDLRSAGYAAAQTGEGGYREMPAGKCVTFAGYLSESGRSVRLNIEPDRVWGYITTDEGEYYIEPLNRFIDEAKKGEYILYNAKHVIASEEHTCGAHEKSEKAKEIRSSQDAPKNGDDDCRILEIATESDFELVEANVTFNDILGNLNMVEDIYLTFFDMKFAVVYQHEWTTDAQPYVDNNSGCGGSGMLPDFGAEWFNNFSAIRRDLSILYSGKNFAGNIIGCAWVGTFGNDFDNDGALFGGDVRGVYSVNQWDWENGLTSNASRRTMVAHEMGHNFGAFHDNTNCNTNPNIMCPLVTESVVFSQLSQTQMTANMNFESDVANDGRSALRERYISADENAVASVSMPGETSANVLFLDVTLTAEPSGFGNTAQFSASDDIFITPGALVNAETNVNFQFDIAPCSANSPATYEGYTAGAGIHADEATALKRDGKASDVILYPNPTGNDAFIQLNAEAAEQIYVNVFDGLGRLVYQSTAFLTEGTNLIEIKSGSFTQGLYFVNLRIGEGESQSLKLQKID